MGSITTCKIPFPKKKLLDALAEARGANSMVENVTIADAIAAFADAERELLCAHASFRAINALGLTRCSLEDAQAHARHFFSLYPERLEEKGLIPTTGRMLREEAEARNLGHLVPGGAVGIEVTVTPIPSGRTTSSRATRCSCLHAFMPPCGGHVTLDSTPDSAPCNRCGHERACHMGSAS